jgi:hypothetical protein
MAKLFKDCMQIPGPLRAIEMPIIEIARRVVRYHDHPELLQRFRLVVQLHDGKWYQHVKPPAEATSKSAVASMQFHVIVKSTLGIVHYGFLDEDLTCVCLKHDPLPPLLPGYVFSPRYQLSP